MKITKLIATNIAPIFTAMGKKHIEIDLSNQKNRIILLVGPNGSGKTSILSLLNPYAYPGSMDIRSGKDFILEGENGYKEIHYLHNGNEYIIKHFYQFKNDKGIKSFISKNGKELNPNGNVKSFNEIVELELSIESDLFRLLRLGSNVSGFIDMKASDRKNFMSDLLKDINLYLKLHKKVGEDARVLKSLIKTVTFKIAKLKVFNENDEREKMSKLNDKISKLRLHRDEIASENGKLQGFIESLIPQGLDSFILETKSLEREYSGLKTHLNDLGGKISSNVLVIEGDVDSKIKEITMLIDNHTNSISLNKSKIDFFFTQLNSLITQKQEKEENLKYVSSELQYDRLSDYYLELNKKKDKLGEKFKNFNPKCTKDDMLKALSLLQEINEVATNVYEFSSSSINDVVDMFNKGQDVDSFVRREVNKIDRRINSIHSELERLKINLNNEDKVYVLYVPHDTNCECPYRKFYEDHKQIPDKESHSKKLRAELESLEVERERLLSYIDIMKKIEYIFMVIKSNKNLIERMPEDFFNIKNILNSIKNRTIVYDEDYITNYISALEEYEEFKELDNKIKETKKELQFIEKNSSSLTSLQNEIFVLDEQISSVEKDIEKLKEESNDLNKKITLLESSLADLNQFKKIKELISETEEKLKETIKLIEEKKETHGKIQYYLSSIERNRVSIRDLDREISELEAEVADIDYRLREFNALNEERKTLEEKYEEVEIIRESLSSTKGVPLLYIQLYLKSTKTFVNQLLESVYQNTLEIDDFVINEDEFRIPYIKKGVRVHDAIRCSQGERTFISLAISFALIVQSLRDYNIMLLDEIDSTLDTSYRTTFIGILETLLDVINCEQTFLITHNNMFDNYPVDIIMTSDVSIDNYRNVNILFKAS